MKFSVNRILNVMKDAQILDADVLKRVSMTMGGILYETGLIKKLTFSGGTMKQEKITSNLEFDVKYADGSRKEVKEGILFEFKGDKVCGHIGTSRKEALFSVAESLTEMIVDFGLAEEFEKYIENAEFLKKVTKWKIDAYVAEK